MLNRRERRRLRRKSRYKDPMAQRRALHRQLISFAAFHIIIFVMSMLGFFSFSWYWVSLIWAFILVKKYIQYFLFTDHPTADDEEKQYLPPPRAEDWLSRRPGRRKRVLKPEKQWRDRDLV